MRVKEFIDALSGDDWCVVADAMKGIEDARQWPEAIAAVARSGLVPRSTITDAFYTYWTTRGFRIRAHVADDVLMLDALWLLLPRYHGAALPLYRGENLDRWRRRQIGFGWTANRPVAVMFASGLAASEGMGGILIGTDARADAIIAGPGRHSQYLGEDEYIVDPRRLGSIMPLEQFPRID